MAKLLIRLTITDEYPMDIRTSYPGDPSVGEIIDKRLKEMATNPVDNATIHSVTVELAPDDWERYAKHITTRNSVVKAKQI